MDGRKIKKSFLKCPKQKRLFILTLIGEEQTKDGKTLVLDVLIKLISFN